jgi:inhibitor of KinA
MTTTDTPKIFPLGNGALTVEFGHDVSVELNERAIALATYMDANPFDGYIEAAPAYASTTIFFDVSRVRRVFADFPTAHQAVLSLTERALSNLSEDGEKDSRVIEIEISFEPVEALDLPFVAERSGLTEHDVIQIFTSTEYRVYMIGFLPGSHIWVKSTQGLRHPAGKHRG